MMVADNMSVERWPRGGLETFAGNTEVAAVDLAKVQSLAAVDPRSSAKSFRERLTRSWTYLFQGWWRV